MKSKIFDKNALFGNRLNFIFLSLFNFFFFAKSKYKTNTYNQHVNIFSLPALKSAYISV